MKNIIFFLLLFSTFQGRAQQLIPLQPFGNASLRGLCVVTDSIIWASGSKGTVALSTNGGKTWRTLLVKGHEQRDFRDIEAWDENTAIVIAVDTPALILKTTNGGITWKEVYRNNTPGMFLDAMEFGNELNGMVIGDPINGKFFIARTMDGGESWKSIPEANAPLAEEGEALFAASGSNIAQFNQQEAVFVTGGKKSRLFMRDQKISLPMMQGKSSTGANAIAAWNVEKMMIVGGDFANDTLRAGNAAIVLKKGKKIITPKVSPFGYRSSVTFLSATRLIACGSSGVDISEDGGMHWRKISDTGYHVVKKAKKGNSLLLAGGNGRLAKLLWP